MMNIKDFILNIGIPEFKSIIGKKGEKIVVLFILLFISLIAIGVAKGGGDYLKVRMNDPFVSFIDIENKISPIPMSQEESFPVFKHKDAQAIANDPIYNIDSLVSKVRTNYIEFTHKSLNDNSLSSEVRIFKGIILKEQNKFYKTLVKKNLFDSKNVFKEDGWGIVVTKDLCKSLNLNYSETPYINMLNGEILDGVSDTIPIPIAGVVDVLKNNADFLMTETLFNAIRNRSKILKSNEHKDYLCFFILDFPGLTPDQKKQGYSIIDDPLHASHLEGAIIQTQNLSAQLPEKSIEIYYLNKFDGQSAFSDKLVEADYFTFYLNDLDKIGLLSELLKSKYGLEIEQSKVESKKNLDFFAELSNMLSTSIILFALLSMIIFIRTLVISHINANKKNLGTLQAFGLSNNYIIVLYTSISFVLVLISFSSSFLFSELVGQFLIDQYINFNSINNDYLKELKFTNIGILQLVLFLIVIPTSIIIFTVYGYLNNKTPGDLIYERK